MTDPYKALLANIDVWLAEGRPVDAYRALSTALAPQRPLPEDAFVPTMRALRRIAHELGAAVVVEQADAVVADPDGVEPLLMLGWALIEQGAPGPALQVLRRADRRRPGDSRILQELATAYADLGMHASAMDGLMAHPELLTHPMMAYLLAFNAVMAGAVQVARDQLGGLSALADDDDLGFMASTIVDMVARYDAATPVATLDAGDLPGWHFVTTGGLLLHTATDEHEGMNGRYAFVSDSLERCLEGLRGVELVLRAWGAPPTRVWSFPDDRSRALAHAAASLFGAELGTWGPDVGEDPGLIVAYDLSDAPARLLQPLRTKRPGQVLWQHAVRWTARQPIAPDLCTFVYQFLQDPWAAHDRFTEDGTRVRVTADTSPPDARAMVILGTELPEDAARGKSAVLELAMLEAEPAGMPVGRRDDGWRIRFWGTSPVRSSRFV